MDRTGAEILAGILGIVAIVFLVWWKFIRGHESEDVNIPSAAVLRGRAPQILRGLSYLFGVLTLAAALGSGISFATRYHTLHSRFETQAQVVSSEIYSTEQLLYPRWKGIWGIFYGFHCTVEYPIGSQQYQSIADLGIQTASRGSLEKWPARFPPGSTVRIAYDPTDPKNALLTGDFRTAYAPCFFGLWIFALFVSLAVAFFVASKKLTGGSNSTAHSLS